MEVLRKPNDIIEVRRLGLSGRNADLEAKAENTAFPLPVYFLSFQGTDVLQLP
jgi:hypothetical protein